jgi:hypothetical protein
LEKELVHTEAVICLILLKAMQLCNCDLVTELQLNGINEIYGRNGRRNATSQTMI